MGKPVALTEETVAACNDLRAKGRSLAEIARALKVSSTTVWRVVGKGRVQRAKASSAPCRKCGANEWKLYENGRKARCWNCRRISKAKYNGKPQVKAYNALWRRSYPERARAAAVKLNYGMTLMHVQAMREAQGGACAICGERSRLVVDHDHKTNRVRALLCGDCNSALGFAHESPLTLRRAADYIEAHSK